MKKKIILSSLISAAAASLMFAPSSNAESTQPFAQFEMNPYETAAPLLDTDPFELNGYSMVPLRDMATQLGSTITWDQTDQTVTISAPEFGEITLTVDSTIAVNAMGEEIQLPERIMRVNDRVFVPVRSVALLMNAGLKWEPASRTVTVIPHSDSSDPIYISYDFSKDNQDWKSGFSNLPVDYNPDMYELELAREIIPLTDQADQEPKYGLKLSGANRSGDLFMFLSRGVGGLKPNTTYDVKLNFAMYTKQKAESVGVGGVPEEAGYVKAGIVNKEPEVMTIKDAENLYYQMNLDIGDPANSGEDAMVLGDIYKPDSDQEGFQRVDFEYSATVESDAQGKIYLLIGTDSELEGLSTLYFSDIQVTATPK